MRTPVLVRLILSLAFLLSGPLCRPTLASGAVRQLLLGDEEQYALSGHMEVLKDPSRRMSFEEALAAWEAGKFRPIPENLNAGYERAAHWVHLSVRRTGNFPALSALALHPNYTNSLVVHVLQSGRDPSREDSYRRIALGSDVPVSDRPILTPSFVVPLDLPSDEPVDVFIRVYSKGSISLSGTLSTYEALQSATYSSLMFQFTLLGIAAIISLISLVFFIPSRDRLFLYLSLYALTVLLNNLGVEGMGALLFPGVAHLLTDYLVYTMAGALILVFSEFAYTLFMESGGLWSLRFIRFMSLIGFLTIIAVPLGFYHIIVPYAFIGSIALIVLLLVMSRRLLYSMPTSGIYITIAFAVSTLGYCYQMLRLLGLFPLLSRFEMNMVEPATLVHMVLILIALSERFRITERRFSQASRLAEKRAIELAIDMTSELRENKERLEVALATEHLSAERQNRFLTMLSHEYRTPLAIIQGNLDILAINAEDGSEEESAELKKMRKAVSRLVDVMEVSLEQSRLLDPHVAGKLTRFSAEGFVRQQVEAVRWMWPDRNFMLQSTLEGERIEGDMPLLNTAIFNLLDNARKYSPKESSITITTGKEDGRILIRVTNISEGLDWGEAEALFEKYRRGSSSHNTSGGGIGLWLVRHIVGQHGGSVRMSSGENGEVTLTVTLSISDGK